METLNLVLTIVVTVLTSGLVGLKLSKVAINKAIEETKDVINEYVDAKKPDSDGGVQITVKEWTEIGKQSIEAFEAIQNTGIFELLSKLFKKNAK